MRGGNHNVWKRENIIRGSDHNFCFQEEPETERSGYECAPYNVLETATDYQVFVRLYIIAKVCLT